MSFLNILNILIYNITLNDSVPYSLYKNWNLFFLNSLDSVNMTSISKTEYLVNYIFLTNVFNNINANLLLNYFIIIILVCCFSFLYIKKSSINNLSFINIYEIVWFLAVTYCMFYCLVLDKNMIGNYNYTNLVLIFIILVVFFSTISTFKLFNIKLNLEIFILVQLVCGFGITLININNFALFIVCLEGFSLTLYILASVNRTYGNISASIKYFIFGTLGSILLYWGCILVFEITNTLDINFIKEIINNKFEFNNNVVVLTNNSFLKLILSLNLIIIGFLVKLGAAPFHQWIPDVYAGVSMFITSFYAIIVKLFLFLLFLKFSTLFITTKEIEYAAFFSIIIGCFGTLRQTELKRFLAYGSITHTGYLLLCDIPSVYIYLVGYLVATTVLFSIISSVKINNKEIIYLSDLRFLNKSLSYIDRSVFVIILASMAGLPPFIGFYGKMLVWMSLIEDIYLYNDMWSFILLIINLVLGLIVIFYYMQVLCILFINNEWNNYNIIITKFTGLSLINDFTQHLKLQFIQVLSIIFITFGTFSLPYLYYII